LGNSLQTKHGRIACEAQDEVLQVCDQLYVNNSITENQLLYLRHLVLIRDESVANIYDDFQEHETVQLLANALNHLANTHPFQARDQASSSDLIINGKAAGKAGQTKSQASSELSYNRTTLVAELSGVAALMLRARMLTNTESSILMNMIFQENEFIIAAYDLYKKDKNLEDLQDTLLRCVKLEVRKRIADEKEAKMNEGDGAKDEEENEVDYEHDFDEEEEADGDGDGKQEDAQKEKDKNNQDVEDAELDAFTLEDISLESILETLHVNNIWENLVPAEYVKLVFIAVWRKYLSLDQAKALCDLYHAKYDLIHAAWEVYTVQNDRDDFIDTVRRVVRDLDFDEIRRESSSSSSQNNTSMSAKTSSAISSTKSSNATKPSSIAKPVSALAPTSAPEPLPSPAQQMNARKTDALQAVQAAKYQLLKHSLDMLVKQSLINVGKANSLLERYQVGDIMIDAAIETYAGDRDVVEFLDTLQILANNSKEDLEELMQAAEQDEQEQESFIQSRSPIHTAPSTTASANGATKNNSNSSMTEGGMSVSEIAFLQVEDIVQEMLKNDMIGPNIAQAFRVLLTNKDDRLVMSYQAYLQNKNGADFVDSLLRIVIASVEGVTSASNVSGSGSDSGATVTAGRSPKSSLAKTSPQTKSNTTSSVSSAIPAADQKTVINILQRAKAISTEQAGLLYNLADAGDMHIQQVFVQYEQHKDIYQLMDGLKGLRIHSHEVY
jgi:hypothetical protein